MYGGVSLAIYINGVSHEFFNAVRGQGVYRLIKELTDSEIVVDAISGTSAGGINGILLAYALCNEKDFGQASSLWRQHGDIRNLLRAPYPANQPSSLLDSENYYKPHLEEVFERMSKAPASRDCAPSPFSELDLFITGTNIDGERYTRFDDLGHAIEVKEHRTLFWLKHRKGRKEPLNPTRNRHTHVALAKLARITSCFPSAFAPVHVSGPDGKPEIEGEDGADALLSVWGNLKPTGKGLYFLDGGILDNKPFSYTLEAIFSRVADREVDRKLFFVEPDPENVHTSVNGASPHFLQAALLALIGIPGYESIAEDLKGLTKRNSQIEQYHRIVSDLRARLLQEDDMSGNPNTRMIYERTRLVTLSDRVIEGILKTSGRQNRLSLEEREAASLLAQTFDSYTGAQEILHRFDVNYLQRRVYHTIYFIYDLLYGSPRPDRVPLTDEMRGRYELLWRFLNQLSKLYEILHHAMEKMLDEAPITWKIKTDDPGAPADGTALSPVEIWSDVRMRLEALLQYDADGPLLPSFYGERDWLSDTHLDTVHAELGSRIRQIVRNEIHARSITDKNLVQRAEEVEKQVILALTNGFDDPIRKVWKNFIGLDSVLFPIEQVGGLREKDVIETIRVSPRDAQKGFSRLDLNRKISGDTVFHFSSFFKRSWRANDILWGRLDGTCQLIETLFDRKRIGSLAQNEAWRKAVKVRMDSDPCLSFEAIFPSAGKATQQELEEWTNELLSDRYRKALDRFDDIVELLVEAAQFEILKLEYFNVVGDALSEQNEWNHYMTVEPGKKNGKPADSGEVAEPPGVSGTPWAFRSSRRKIDPFVSAVMAADRVLETRERFLAPDPQAKRPSDVFLGKIFRENYQVGSEELVKHVPTAVLLEILSTALLVVRNLVMGLFNEETARRVRSSPVYRFGLDWPLRAFHAFTILLRNGSHRAVVLVAGVSVLCVLALVVGVVWRQAILVPGGVPSPLGLLIFLLIPGVLLSGIITYLVWKGRKFGRRKPFESPHEPRAQRPEGAGPPTGLTPEQEKEAELVSSM